MDLSLLPFVNYEDLRALVGPAAVHRGLAYASNGSVRRIRWVESRLELQGLVAGTEFYETSVTFADEPKGAVPIMGDCSCPVGYNCKHVAALLFASNRLLEDQQSAPGIGAARAQAVEPPEAPLWEQQLESLLNPPARQAVVRWNQAPEPAVPAAPVPMALQFELVEDPPDPYAGRYRPWHTGTPGAQPRIRLGVRPLQRNDAGKWVVGNLGWDGLPRAPYTGGLNPRHVEWLRIFHSVHAATQTLHDADRWLYLNDFNTPLMWQLLEQGTALGLTLVTSRKSTTLTQASEALLASDVVAVPDGGVRLIPRVTVGGVVLDPARIGTLGTPVHGLFWWEGGPKAAGSLPPSSIGFAPVTQPVGQALKLLIDARAAVEVPAGAREQFLTSYYPQLRNRMDLHSSDGSAALPEAQDPELVLTVVHVPAAAPGKAGPAGKSGKAGKPGARQVPAAGPALELHWHWEYPSGDAVAKHPLVNDGGGTREEAFEARVRDGVSTALAAFPAATEESFPDPVTLHPGSNEPVHLKAVAAARFSTEALPMLAHVAQLRVDVTGVAPDYTELTGTPQIGISTKSSAGGDWFDLGVTVALDGTEIPFGDLFLALATEETHLMLPNGHYFALNQPEFERLRRLIEEARTLQEPGETLKISRYQAGLWEELKELATSSRQAAAWKRSVTGLLELAAVAPVPVPATLQAELRPYQQEGFNWLAFLFDHNLGGVLADDMGLGKTLQTLALFCHAQATRAPGTPARPFLVVAPTSVVSNWAAEAHRFAPTLTTTAVTDTLGRSGTGAATLLAGVDVVITSYTLFRLDQEAYSSQDWAGLILDEAQFVKNHQTKASQVARAFPAAFKLAITGTPLENNLMELWSLFAITSPGLFPSPTQFTQYYRTPVEKDGDTERLQQLRHRIRPLLMRRTKETVAKDLPPKQEQVLELELAPRHRTIYQRHLQHERQKVLGLLGDMDKNRFAIFKSITTLRMLSLDASLVDPAYASAPSSKLDVLFEQLEEVVAEGHRALIFSQFTSFLGKARERLEAAGIEYAYLDGKTRRRGEVIDGFKSGTAPVFLISLKSGGFGLNLTEADYCFLLDPWWNPATENQAVDRAHRIGQTKNVMVYRLVAKDTIEEKVMALKDKKAQLFSSVLDDDAMFSAAITSDDVRGLFEG